MVGGRDTTGTFLREDRGCGVFPLEFCPVCMLRQAIADGVESGEFSTSEEMVKPALEQAVQRFEH